MKVNFKTHFFPALLVFFVFIFLLIPIANHRPLWQDELETAERSRSIVEYGIPLVIDQQNQISTNTGGREIEEGLLHRYSPWGQFYLGALGLQIARMFSFDEKESVRWPFIGLHGASAALIVFGSQWLLGFPPLGAVALGMAYGIQSVHLLHNRTARYHGALDFFLLLGLMGLGLRQLPGSRRTGQILLGLSLFLLPHFQTLGGSLMAFLLGALGVLQSALMIKENTLGKKIKSVFHENFLAVFVSGFLSLTLLILLTRPWLQGVWAQGAAPLHHFRSLHSRYEIAHSFYFGIFFLIYFLLKKKWSWFFAACGLTSLLLLTVRLLDFHPFSQSRYYLAVPLLILFWMWAFPKECFLSKKVLGVLIGLSILIPDLEGSNTRFQGLRVLFWEWTTPRQLQKQPLQEALDLIRSTPGPVASDYVPQFVNWYLPEHPVALIPDPQTRHPLSESNSLWSRPMEEPLWHLWYPTAGSGYWACSPRCDFQVDNLNPSENYILISHHLKRSWRMCVVKTWSTDKWNNSPFSLYERGAFQPEGAHLDQLILARRCDKEE